MCVLVAGGTGFVGSATDSDFVVNMVVVAHSEAGTGSDTDWVGIAHADRMLMLGQPEDAHHSSSSRSLEEISNQNGPFNPNSNSMSSCVIQ